MKSLRQFLKTATARLALSYLLIIMLMSIGFSFVFYNTSSHEVGKHYEPPASPPQSHGNELSSQEQHHDLDIYFQQRAEAVRHELQTRLIAINLLIFGAGSVLSYYLARKNLRPIEANMDAQSQFVSDASHELRTPLTALQTTNEVALRKPKITSTEAKVLFQQNIEEVMKLRLLTDSLLNLAKNDSGTLALSPTALSDVVSDAINVVISHAVAKKISIVDNVPKLTVTANKVSLSQALVTILDNAIKYSSPNSTVQVGAVKEGKFVLLSIKDQGIGIQSVHLHHIFERFYRADDSRNKQRSEGFGIGLALAKKIVDQHQGKIAVVSKPGKGSTFTLKLPLG